MNLKKVSKNLVGLTGLAAAITFSGCAATPYEAGLAGRPPGYVPAPVYAAPAPVYVAPAPVIVEPAPIFAPGIFFRVPRGRVIIRR